MLKDFYVFVDLEEVNVKPIKDVICDSCGDLLYDEEGLNKTKPFYAFFYEIEEGDIVFSRIFCKECKEKVKNYTVEAMEKGEEEKREIIETDFENAPEDFKRDIVRCLTSPFKDEEVKGELYAPLQKGGKGNEENSIP